MIMDFSSLELLEKYLCTYKFFGDNSNMIKGKKYEKKWVKQIKAKTRQQKKNGRERGNNEDEDANTYHTAAGRAGTSIIIGTTSTVSSTFCQ